jgi:GTP-binding protein
MMRARSARFLTSAASAAAFPAPAAPEIGFAGRSNVGKSSLINVLTGVKGLARTSSTPGRTRLLNWFDVVPPTGPALRFVDFPGYGYAKVSKQQRAGFEPLVGALIQDRASLRLVIVIVDARRGLEDEEHELIGWLAENSRPALVVLTKADKLPKSQRFPAAAAAGRELDPRHTQGREPILFSATTGEGVDALWRAILAAVSGA